VKIQAGLLRALPVHGYAVVDVRLVNDLGDQLRRLIDGARVWRRELSAENGIFAAGSDQKTEQCPYAVHCEAENDDGDEQEYGDASPHGCWCCSVSFPSGDVVHGRGVQVKRSRGGGIEMGY
jgi:hypothetical protein